MLKSKAVWALVALNALLLVWLVAPYGLSRTARAQAPARPSEYLMLPGEVIGGNSALVYIIDEGNRQLSGMAMNQSNQIEFMPAIELDRVFNPPAAPAVGARP